MFAVSRIRIRKSCSLVGVRIGVFELLDGPPRRSTVGDVTAEAFRHARVEDSEHPTISSEDERARVALCGEVARRLAVVVNGHFDRLFAELIAKISLQSGIAAYSKVGDVAVLSDDVNGIPFLVVTVGSGEEFARNDALDLGQSIGGEIHPGRIGTNGPEHGVEFVRSKFVF